jgi:hypothetical protein
MTFSGAVSRDTKILRPMRERVNISCLRQRAKIRDETPAQSAANLLRKKPACERRLK